MDENRTHTQGFSWLVGLLLVFCLEVFVGFLVVLLGFLSFRGFYVKIEFWSFIKLVLIIC